MTCHRQLCFLPIPNTDDARDADIEVDAADVFFGRPSSEDCSTAPYDVSSKSGIYPAALTVTPSISSASPPLGTPFDVDSDSPESQLAKQRRYAEGLERGIQEFLNQKLPLSFSSSHEHQAQDAIIAPSQGRGHRGRVTKGRKHNSRSGNELVPRGSDWPAVQLTDESQLMLEAAQGFVLMLDGQHRILYVSENVRQHLGHEQPLNMGSRITQVSGSSLDGAARLTTTTTTTAAAFTAATGPCAPTSGFS
ncbi:hypothetical protein Btru_056581 [Bulinus truncatus]|nr:hypothetical protein Btru_056581 [Bulinus truncatus]